MTNNAFPQQDQPRFNQPPAANSTQGAALTADDQNTIRQGVFGALAYVSQADPGFFASFVESAAGAKVLAAAPADVKQLLAGGLTLPQAKSMEEFKATAMPNLHAAIELVQAKNPQAAADLKAVVLQAVQAVAAASKGVSANEQAAIAAIQQALA